jgi:hypothetical protein
MSDELPKFQIKPQPVIKSDPLPPPDRPQHPSSAKPDFLTGVDPKGEPPQDLGAGRPAGGGGPFGSSAPASPTPDTEISRLGADLAQSLRENGYHPIILFGTTASGKTSLLLSLFSTLKSEPRLRTDIRLCANFLGPNQSLGPELHKKAKALFENGTQAFIAGEKIPPTPVELPFFVPVEIQPKDKPAQKFAFLESAGEFYQTTRKQADSFLNREDLYKPLNDQIESFLSQYDRSVSFLYLAPYTHGEVYDDSGSGFVDEERHNSSLAIGKVIETYERLRYDYRTIDNHLMLVTKWDARSKLNKNTVESMKENRRELIKFCHEHYGLALTRYQSLPGRPQINAYSSGKIGKTGLQKQSYGSDTRMVLMGYPAKLWGWLYTNARRDQDQRSIPLFPVPPKQPLPVRVWNKTLDYISGR